jgi:putative oxidoreductase
MNATLLAPRPSFASLVLRMGLAAIFIVHGWIKLDVGMDQSSEMIAGISRPMQTAIGAAEFVCGLALLLGLASRIAAAVIGVIQFGAIVMVSGEQQPEIIRSISMRARYLTIGPEYNMVLGVMCLAVILLGSGLYSLDHVLACRMARKQSAAPTT